MTDPAERRGSSRAQPGLLVGVAKAVIEAALEAELVEHLGYAKYHSRGRSGGGNSRNGSRSKTVRTTVGPVDVEVPRDRLGTFDPLTVRKWQRQAVGIDRVLLPASAQDAPLEEVVSLLARVYPRGASRETLRQIATAVRRRMTKWHRRRIDARFAVLELQVSALRTTGGQTVGFPVASVIGSSTDGGGFVRRELLCLQAAPGGRDCAPWRRILADLNSRGLVGVRRLIGEVDSLPLEAIRDLWPGVTIGATRDGAVTSLASRADRTGGIAVAARPLLDFRPVALTIGIVGLPNAGKSTLFNALTKNDVLAANYPFATIEPNVGVVAVPEPRLARLAELFHSARAVPATVEFVDIAGIVRGASEGEGLGNKFLSHIRESAAICQVTRVFRDEDVSHVDGRVDPASDIETIRTELALADLQTLEKAIPRLEKDARGKKDLLPVVDAARTAQAALEDGTPVIDLVRSGKLEGALLRELSLLTAKPYLYVFNCDSDELFDEELKRRMQELVAPSEAIFLDAKLESELVELDDDDEAREMLRELGVEEPGLDVLARVGFDTLGLQTYLTAGPKESRAWTIRKGATAPEAAGVIHTDFQRGFIKAEVVSYDDLLAAGSLLKAKEAGKVRIEGKDYVMADGDVVEFRFNV